jgi:hypothetical protein
MAGTPGRPAKPRENRIPRAVPGHDLSGVVAIWADRPVAHYFRPLQAIAAMGGVAQAVARLAITKRPGWRMRIENVLRAVGAWDDAHTPSARQRRHHARVSLGLDTVGLGELGIQLTADTLEYTPVAGVWVSVLADSRG